LDFSGSVCGTPAKDLPAKGNIDLAWNGAGFYFFRKKNIYAINSL
jgi:hypothetical protein